MINANFYDIVAIRDYSGDVVAMYEYDAWGNCTVMDGNGNENNNSSFIGNINPYRYRGYYYDVETGFYYLQTRYYDPSICRFINADNYELIASLSNVPGQLNLYAYCGNNPIMFTDETGELLLSTILVGALVGFGVSFLSSIITQAAFNEGKVNWGTALIDGAFGAAAGALGTSGLSALWVGVGNGVLSLGNGLISTGIEQNWNYTKTDLGIIIGSSVLSGFVNGVMYKKQLKQLLKTNAFVSKINGRIASGYYGTGARAVKSIASASAQANKMVLNYTFGEDFYIDYLITFAQANFSESLKLGFLYLV